MEMERLDMEIASEFLVTAATLLHIKSRLLLPTVEDDEEPVDPRTELVLQLLEYRKCKAAAQFLKERHPKADLYFYRRESGEDFGKTEITYELDKATLRDIYVALKERNTRKHNRQAGYVNNLIRHEKFTVAKKIREIAELLMEKIRISFFSDIRKKQVPKLDVIVGFLSMLELAMEKKAVLEQKGIFQDIIMKKTRNLEKGEYDDYVDQYK
jgi:segregation and condensation protein A